MYQALYRKWRPKTFDEVVGQKHITETLKTSDIDRRHLARVSVHRHARHGQDHLREDTCQGAQLRAPAWTAIPAASAPPAAASRTAASLDVVEIDAASNNGVDNVRQLREEAVFSPAAVRKRVYIIDEVHMLSTAAFNALLKILEEPPEHLVFILATTELQQGSGDDTLALPAAQLQAP